MPREEEEVRALDESFNTRLEKALAQDANGTLSLESSRNLSRSPLQAKQTKQVKERAPTDGYLSDDDKFQQLLDKRLMEEQEKLERQGIPAQDGIPLVPAKKDVRGKTTADKENTATVERRVAPAKPVAPLTSKIDSLNDPPSDVSVVAELPMESRSTSSRSRSRSRSRKPSQAASGDDVVADNSNVSVVCDLPSSSHSRLAEARRGTYVVENPVDDAKSNVSIVGDLPSTSRPGLAEARRVTSVASTEPGDENPTPAVDVNDKKLKTPRKAGGMKLAAGTPMAGTKTDAQSLLGKICASASLASSLEQDPRLLRENNRRLAQELNRARLDMREMHDHHEQERKDLQDEIVRLRQLAGEKDDGMREMLEKRVERALTCHNGALEKVATLLGDDMPTKLHCRISFILENVTKLKAIADDVMNYLFGDAQPTGKLLELLQLVNCIHDNTQEHDDMIRNFVEKLCDAQLNLQLALEDDVDFLSSSAMPTIMNPLNASTMHHDRSRLPQILSDKTETLQRNGGDRDEEDEDVASPGQPSHELSNVMEEDESKRASSYLARKRSSALTRRTSVVPQPQNAENEEPIRRSRNSRRESMRLSSGFPQAISQAIFKSPRVSQLQSGGGGTPTNRVVSLDGGSPSSLDGSPDVLDRPVISPNLSLTETGTALQLSEPIALDLNVSAQNATSTETNDMELTTSEPSPSSAPSAAATAAASFDVSTRSLDVALECEGRDVDGEAPADVASASLRSNASDDSLITPGVRRVSSFVRLYATPPEEGNNISQTVPPPLASPLLPFVASMPPSSAVEGDDEEPQIKKIKSSTELTDVDDPIASTGVSVPSPAASSSRGSRKSKMVAAQHLKEISSDDGGVFVPPAPPKPKGGVKSKKRKDAEKKTEEENQRSSSSSDRASAKASSQNAKVGDVDMETYKKMIVGQKAKPGRSKSRKLSKSEEREIRAVADIKAKSKPLEYAAFDASSRFGEGLSFLDETHVPTLHEFKQKQITKPASRPSATAPPSSSSAPPAPSTASAAPSTASAAPSTASAAPSTASAATCPTKTTTTTSASKQLKKSGSEAATLDAEKPTPSSPGVSEDFLTATSTTRRKGSTSASKSSPAPSENKGAAGGGKGGRKKVDYRESVGDDDDFVAKKPRKRTTKSKANAKKNEKNDVRDVFFSPEEGAASDRARAPSASSVGSVEDQPAPGAAPAGKKKKKKKSSSLFYSCGEDEEIEVIKEIKESPIPDDAQTDRRRGRGAPKSYAEPAMNKKMRR